ncbi:hypothetical protein AX14_010473 [Amanita brunnescens Koide BX004]|nr:hypothetical protein AX14_010473 [Amanita brunnescens Koide BX004]
MSSRKRRATDEDVEPRVAATQSQSQLLFLRYGDRKPVVTLMKPSLSDIEQVARQFFECPANTRLKFYKKFGNELVQIDPAAWPHINEATTSLCIEAEEVSWSSRLVRQPAHSSFHIFGQSPSGQFRIKINANTTVATLKSAIENKVSIPVEDQRLVFPCMRLADCDTLVSCGVTQDSTLDLYPPTPISVNVTFSLVPA